MTRGVMAQAREILGTFCKSQRFPEAQRPGAVEVLEDPRGRRRQAGVVHVIMVNNDPEGRVLDPYPAIRHECRGP